MIYFVVIADGFIESFGTAEREVATVISKERYEEINGKIGKHSIAPDGYNYKLRADNLEWEMVELPDPEPINENAEISDYENALSDLGVQFND